MEKNELSKDEMMMFEKYFNGDESIPLEDRYFYFQMLRQTKDLMDSKHTISSEDPTRFEMVFMNLCQEEEGISFSGAVSNGIENRAIDGIIKAKGKRHYVLTHVYRMHQSVPENIKEYYVYDTFKQIKDKWYQESVYDESLDYRRQTNKHIDIYKKPISGFDMDSFYEFREEIGQKYSV